MEKVLKKVAIKPCMLHYNHSFGSLDVLFFKPLDHLFKTSRIVFDFKMGVVEQINGSFGEVSSNDVLKILHSFVFRH